MKVISFFSGAGGMDLGFSLAGHDIVWANDFDKNAIQSYNYNIGKYDGNNAIFGDITEILDEYSQMEGGIDGKIPDADIVIGGFPCQGFSIANVNRNMENDERNFLYLELLRIIDVKNPRFVVLENVKGLENIEQGEVLNMIINDLEKTGKQGYTVVYNVLNAYNYGVPQNRERVIILGVRNDILDRFEIPSIPGIMGYKRLNVEKTHSLDSNMKDPVLPYEKVNNMYDLWKNGKLDFNHHYYRDKNIYSVSTIRDAIENLPREFEPDNEEIHNHDGSKCKVKISNRVGNRATEWDKYAPTIMGRGSGTGGPLIIPHPEQHRRMSVREVARIQTFPDSFIFQGSNSAGYRQIGNAVPVLMAYNIAKIIPIEI